MAAVVEEVAEDSEEVEVVEDLEGDREEEEVEVVDHFEEVHVVDHEEEDSEEEAVDLEVDEVKSRVVVGRKNRRRKK